MTDFEKSLHAFIAGKSPESSLIQFDIGRACTPKCIDEPAMLRRNLTIIVAAVFIDEENNVLLIQEAKQGCRGKWYLPAGRLEENETLEEGVKREVTEEAGIHFEPTTLICIENYPSRDACWLRFTYTGKITGGKLKTTKQADKESLQAKWIPVKSLKCKSSDFHLRAYDVLPLIDACATHQRLVAEGQRRIPILPFLQAHKHMSVRLVLVRKIMDKFDVLISTTGQSHLPVIQDMKEGLPSVFQQVFGAVINVISQKGVLCVEHLGKSRQIFADGVCLTILVFTTSDKNPKVDLPFSWYRIQNVGITEDLDRRMKQPENSIPLVM